MKHETLTEIFAIDYDTNKIDKCIIQGGQWVRAYRRKDGIVVHGHCRRR